MNLISYFKKKKDHSSSDKLDRSSSDKSDHASSYKSDHSSSSLEPSEIAIPTTSSITPSRYFGFDLGSNTSTVATVSELSNQHEDYDEPTSKLLSNCYPDSELQLPPFIKPLLGRKFSDSKLSSHSYLLGTQVSEGLDGFPVFLGTNNLKVTIPQLLSESLSYLCRKIPNGPRLAYCIGIPVYFTDLQRRIVIDAAREVGINPKLLHETSASAVAYACRNIRDLYGTKKQCVTFVDMGITSMQVCVAEFDWVSWKVLSHAFDNSLGGKAFDEVLFNHFVAKFREERGIDVMEVPHLYSQLYSACEKMKIELSSSEETFFAINWNGKKLVGHMKREEFERMCAPLLERVEGPLEKALNDSGLCIEDIQSVQSVGLASQIPAIIKKLTNFFRRQPNQIQEGKKLVAKGCVLNIAHFEIAEHFPHSIAMSWDAKMVEIESPEIIFPEGTPFNTSKIVPFLGSTAFKLDFMYVNVGDSDVPTRVCRFKISPFQSSTSCERVSGEFGVRLDKNGIVTVYTASMLETGKCVELQVSQLDELEEQLKETKLETERSKSDQDTKQTSEMEQYVFYDAED